MTAYAGKNGAVAAYTPVDRASVADQLNSVTSHVQVSRRSAPKAAIPAEASVSNAAEDDPGTIAETRIAPSPVNVGANLQGQGGQGGQVAR